MDVKTSDDDCVNFAASLFRAKSLADIQTVRQKLCKDAERHREELRLVVGEKYHELIEAADTFEMMKESSFNVFNGLENCRKLSLKIISDSANSIQNINSTRRICDDNLKMAVNTVIWLVEVIPQIWQSIEAQELPGAVKKYKQCCEVIEGSFFQSIRSEKVKTFASKLRLTLDCVPSALITSAIESLNECSLKKEVATESVFVLLVLKENSLRKMFEDFLSLRLKGFQKLCAQTVTFSVFKNILSEWENYVMTTLDCVRSIFGNNDPASIFGHLRQIEESTLDTKMKKYFPVAVQNYSLPLNIATDLSPEEVEEIIDSWEREAKSSVAAVLENFFKNVTSVKSCAKLRILAFQKLSVKGKCCQFWQDYLFTVVQNCIENLVAKSISEILYACFSSFEQNLDDKNDFDEWLWQESAETAYQVAVLSHTNDLALKSRGIPTSVRNVYQSMDEALGKLLNDASYYVKQLEENDAELSKVKEIVSNAAFALIGELLKKSASIKSLSYGKFLFSVAELNGNIQQALFYGPHDWKELKIELYKSHEAQLNVWIDLVSSDFKKNLKDRLSSLIKDGSSSLGLRWNTIELNDVSARIPCGICIPLLESLLNLEEKLSKAGGHTLGRAAVHKITSQTGDSVTTAYAECISDANLSQTLALQFYFDIQFVVTLLLGREDKELQARATDLFKQLECWIDPIDLEILSPHWQSQVSIAVNSMKLLYHCLTPFEKAGIQEFKIASGHYSRIATCTTRPAFKPLTLMPKPGKAVSIVSDKMKTTEEQMVSATKPKMEQSPVALSNRSFLGAMSSSWFGK